MQMVDRVANPGRVRVIVALFAFAWIAVALFVGLWLWWHSPTIASAEGRGLGSALVGALVFVGVNRELHHRSGRKVTWRTRFPAAWVGAILGIAFLSPLMGPLPAPPEFDFSDAIAMDKMERAGMRARVPSRLFDSPVGTGGFGIALLIQLGAFLIAASRHTYPSPRPWQFWQVVTRWHWGKIVLLWASTFVGASVVSVLYGGSRDAFWAFALLYGAGVGVVTWRWLSAKEGGNDS